MVEAAGYCTYDKEKITNLVTVSVTALAFDEQSTFGFLLYFIK